MADWFPRRLADLPPFFNNLAIQASLTGTAHGLSAAQVTAIGVWDDSVGKMIDKNLEIEAYRQAYRQFLEIMLYAPIGTPMPTAPTPPDPLDLLLTAEPSIEPKTRQIRGILFAHPSWNTELAEAWGLLAPGAGPGPDKPTLTGKAETDFHVRLTFAMMGHDLLEIYSKRGSETEWTLLAFDTASPYLDGREPLVAGQPEIRQYRARYRDGDTPFGEWSDVITVTANP